MSLIRSTSNHEKIYAYHNVSGHTCIHKGPYLTISVLIETFETAIRKWLDSFEDEDVKINGFSISQRLIDGLNTIFLEHDEVIITMSYATFSYMIDRYKFNYYNEIGAIV